MCTHHMDIYMYWYLQLNAYTWENNNKCACLQMSYNSFNCIFNYVVVG